MRGGAPVTTPAPIYVVDDDASVRDAVGRLVRSAGWKVETFASAQAFLASCWADVPSCLILDVQLPGLSGLDLQQRLANSGARTSIIFLTGHGDIPTSVRAISAGARIGSTRASSRWRADATATGRQSGSRRNGRTYCARRRRWPRRRAPFF